MVSSALILTLLGLGILAAGFLIGRYYIPDNRSLSDKASRADAYIEAVTLLARAEGDEAIDRLLDVVRSYDVGEVETYFALGALFRARGEWERAIRVHQTLALRDKKERLRCTFELGLDYQAAGMPKRATRAMEEVLSHRNRRYDERVLLALAQLYEEQGRYADAADAWRRLGKVRGVSLDETDGVRRHHLMVAAAQRASDAGDWDSAKRLLRDARRGDTPSAHALVASAEIAMARGNPKGATAQLERALAVAPAYARLLVPGLLAAQSELVRARMDKETAKADRKASSGGDGADPDDADAGEDAGEHDPESELRSRSASATVTVLERVLDKIGRNGHIEMAISELRSFYDPVQALEDYQRIADEFPAFLPARVASARLALASGDAELMRDELRALAASDGVLAWAMEGSWRCAACGKRDDTFFWRCRHCREWGSTRLDVGRDVLDIPAPRPQARNIVRGGVSMALLGVEAADSLPDPTLESGLSDEELTRASRRPSILGRVGSWFSGAFSSRKSEKEPESANAALPTALTSDDEKTPDRSRALPPGPSERDDAFAPGDGPGDAR